MNIRQEKQKGFSAIIAVVLIVLFSLLGIYMATLSNIGSLNTTQSLGSMQAWFATRSTAEWAIYQALNRPACTCGTDCCTTAPAINGATINFTLGGANGFQGNVTSCTENTITEASSTYCVYNLGITTSKGTLGGITYVSRSIDISVTDAP